jgi:hypothetical protein
VPVELGQPAWLVLLALVVPVALVELRRPVPFGRGQRATALGVRAALVTCLVVAMASPALYHRASGQSLIVAVDRSASTATAQGQEVSDVEAVEGHLPSQDQIGVVTFGQDALVEALPAHDLEFSGFATAPGPNYTNMQAGLSLAASIAGPGSRRHLVLVSDGRENVGDAVAEARLLRSEGARIDVLPVDVPVGPDVRVDSLAAPSAVLPGGKTLVTAVLVSNETTTARVVWTIDNTRVVQDRVVRVSPGVTPVQALLPPVAPGLHEVSVLISPQRDSVPGNDSGAALFQVIGPSRVLVVAGQNGAGDNVARALGAAGVPADVVGPSEVPVSVAGVARWQAVALVDVSAAELGPQRMQALASATSDLGVGLVAFGGPSTFGPGGFAGTPLEQALPIAMRVRNPEDKTPVAVVLDMESVESPDGDKVARAAASGLVARLFPDDLVGVTDSLTGMIVPLQRVGNGAAVERDIARIPTFGDPASYVPYLQVAAQALAGHAGDAKHIVLMGDGDAEMPSAMFVAGLVRQGITLSAVGLGENASGDDMALLQTMAEEGKGRFYESEDEGQIPSFFFDEADTELVPWIVHERFHVVAVAPSPALDGIEPASIPPLDGYVASAAKPSAEVVLAGPSGDPILAQWQFGLGKAAVWTSDTEGRWSAGLLRSPLGGRLLAGIVASTLPLAPDPALSASAQVEGEVVHLVAQAVGAPPDASAIVRVVSPGGAAQDEPLLETAPGRFEGDVPASQVGPYLMRVELSAGGRLLQATTVGAVVAYSPELRFVGTDMSFLEQVARAGGGTVLSSLRQALNEPLPPVTVKRPFWRWLLLLAVVLLPADVALRRLNLRPERLVVLGEPAPGTAAQSASNELEKVEALVGTQGFTADDEPVLATRLLDQLRR